MIYLLGTSVENYFQFLEEYTPGDPEHYKLLVGELCDKLNVSKTDSMRTLGKAIIRRLEYEDMQQDDLYVDEVGDQEYQEIQKSANRIAYLSRCVYELFVAPLVWANKENGYDSERTTKRLRNYESYYNEIERGNSL